MMFGWFDFSGGSSDGAFGIGIYGDPRAGTWWAKLTVVPVWRAGRALHEARYWLKARIRKRYQHHVVHTGLKPGWHDCDSVMIHAMFALLDRYIEWECGGADKLDQWSADIVSNPDPNAPQGLGEGQAKRQDEAVTLYRWWHETKPADEKLRDEMMHELFGRGLKTEPVPGTDLHRILFEEFKGDRARLYDRFQELEEKIDREEQEMLHRLVDIRRSLWT